jgi:TonB family protein
LACAAACSSVRSPDFPAPELRLSPHADVAAPFSLTASDGTGLVLRELRAQVVVESTLAFTQLEFAFQNPEPRRLEGRLQVTLPEGASVSRLALQIGERYQEGELVAQPQAVAAYEEALHGRRDPALLEREAGNQYRMRIFPIEPHETKRVIVAYSQLLLGGDGSYRLPLAGLAKLERLRADVHWLTGARSERQVFERRSWRPTGDLSLTLPQSSVALASEGLVLVPLRAHIEHKSAGFTRLTVLFDTSASSALQLEQRLERLAQLLAALSRARGAPFPVQLVPFDQALGAPVALRSDDLGQAPRELVRARGALGATDLDQALDQLKALPQLGDRVLLYSDGVATAGSTQLPELSLRVAALGARGVRRLDVLTPRQLLDRELLTALVHSDRLEPGVMVSDEAPLPAAQRMLRAPQRQLMPHVEGALWTYPAELFGVEEGQTYPLFAKFPGPAPTRLRVGASELVVHKAGPSSAALLARAWASTQIAYLEQKRAALVTTDAEKVRQRIIALSTREQVASDHTAWVVLESEDDYRRHGIERRTERVLAVHRGALMRVAGGPAVDDWLLEEPWLRAEHEIEPAEKQGSVAAAVPSAQSDSPLQARTATALKLGSSSGAVTPPQADTPGILGVLSQMSGSAGFPAGSAYGADTALGYDPMSGLGQLSGDSLGVGQRDAGRPASHAMVRVSTIDVRGGSLSPEVMRRVIQRHLNEVRFCGDQALQQQRWLRGKVQVRFVVSSSGAVQAANVESSSLQHRGAESCITNAVRRWTFPAPAGGGIVVASQGFELESSDSVALQAQTHHAAERAQRTAHRLLLQQRESDWAERARPVPADALEGPLLEVTELVATGAHREALLRARALHQAAPHDVMVLLALARAARAHGEPELAARAYGSLIDLFPGRAEFRRAAGQGLESLGELGLGLAIDSYRKALALRPDHPAGHRLLAMARWRAGETAAARETLQHARQQPWLRNRFPGVEGVLADDVDLSRTRRPHVLRVCLYWENDATDVDLIVYDGLHRQVGVRASETSAASLSSDVSTGFGPECVSANADQIAYPYLLQVRYTARGAMGHALGALHIVRTDEHGLPSFEMRPFVLMKEQGYAELGELVAK